MYFPPKNNLKLQETKTTLFRTFYKKRKKKMLLDLYSLSVRLVTSYTTKYFPRVTFC